MKLPTFKNQQLLVKSLTHRSALNERVSSAKESNERLEFLGDAVLELITTNFLFQKCPKEPEGNLTAYRSALVKTTTLAKVAKKLDIGQEMYMSKGEEATGGRDNPSLLADTFEAVVGALYLDQGLAAVEEFLAEHLFTEFESIKAHRLYKDDKSQLQEIVQARGFDTPRYRVTHESGPDHDKQFTVEVLVDQVKRGEGTGHSKQQAQQAAAKEAVKYFEKKA